MKLWIARDEAGSLWLFDKQPVLRDKSVENTEYSWFDMNDEGTFNYSLDDYWFPEVTCLNSPQ